MERLQKAFGGRSEDDEAGIMTEIADVGRLSWATRIKCFAACFIIGVVCSILSIIVMWTGKITMFALLYTVGNISALCGTMFLMGPIKQLKNMFKEKRIIATIIMLLALVLTVCAAVWWKKKGLALLMMAIQYCAMTWYCLSYIPFARDAVKKIFASCF